jgi:hypothetical protein
VDDRRRPPAGITAPEFFETWLPDAFAGEGCVAPDDAPRVRVTLSGPGGGAWAIIAEGSRLTVAPEAARTDGTADVWIRQATPDFLATFARDVDLPELLPPGWSPLDLLFLDPRDVVLVRQISGRILVELAGKRRRRWALDIAIGAAGLAAGRPRATVRIDGATYEGLRNRTVAPLQALLERKIAVEGDRALAMQAMLLMGSRLGRD